MALSVKQNVCESVGCVRTSEFVEAGKPQKIRRSSLVKVDDRAGEAATDEMVPYSTSTIVMPCPMKIVWQRQLLIMVGRLLETAK